MQRGTDGEEMVLTASTRLASVASAIGGSVKKDLRAKHDVSSLGRFLLLVDQHTPSFITDIGCIEQQTNPEPKSLTKKSHNDEASTLVLNGKLT